MARSETALPWSAHVIHEASLVGYKNVEFAGIS